MFSGMQGDFDWFEGELEAASEIQTQTIGHDQCCDSDGKILNLVVR